VKADDPAGITLSGDCLPRANRPSCHDRSGRKGKR
jgi:hypothetical protein